ncbi:MULTISPECIES: Rieske (2Fe-2S) protein [unclassified Corynebacterium]|uniref:Rieske (2Fe-2S) protein n=1 Tax=unclassified Corynebacterium TaxID=2624378 RepID=UPI002A916DDD|nr:Rieske (2Fe-2S) protein [Corynebacterium sp.]MDY5785698.1 Rieske (2Fe-2S) protein [Corynebacterium sp.]
MTCSRRLFLLGSATTLAGAFLVACGKPAPEEVAATEVPVGSAVILDKVIIAQPEPGKFVAYSATCPHEFQKISEVHDEVVRCPAHGATFAVADGSVVSGPVVRGLREIGLTQEGDRLIATDTQA